MVNPIQKSKLLELDENEQRQLRRIKAELSDALVEEIYLSLVFKEQEYSDYTYGGHTKESLKELKDKNKVEVRRLHNKLTQYVERAYSGGFENDEENEKYENEWDDVHDSSEFDEGFQEQ